MPFSTRRNRNFSTLRALEARRSPRSIRPPFVAVPRHGQFTRFPCRRVNLIRRTQRTNNFRPKTSAPHEAPSNITVDAGSGTLRSWGDRWLRSWEDRWLSSESRRTSHRLGDTGFFGEWLTFAFSNVQAASPWLQNGSARPIAVAVVVLVTMGGVKTQPCTVIRSARAVFEATPRTRAKKNCLLNFIPIPPFNLHWDRA